MVKLTKVEFQISFFLSCSKKVEKIFQVLEEKNLNFKILLNNFYHHHDMNSIFTNSTAATTLLLKLIDAGLSREKAMEAFRAAAADHDEIALALGQMSISSDPEEETTLKLECETCHAENHCAQNCPLYGWGDPEGVEIRHLKNEFYSINGRWVAVLWEGVETKMKEFEIIGLLNEDDTFRPLSLFDLEEVYDVKVVSWAGPKELKNMPLEIRQKIYEEFK